MSNRNNHAPRDTTTGKINESAIEEFLIASVDDEVYPQCVVGTQFNTGKGHIVDVMVGGEAFKKTKGAKRWTSNHRGGTLHSYKYQKIDGTAEEKIPFEFLKLQDAIDKYGYTEGIIVLCGESGWTLKEYYLSEKFKNKMKLIAPNVSVITEELYRQRY